jgi:hypothetical protein
MTGAWLANDELFVRELRTGHDYAEHAAYLLRAQGLHVAVTPLEIRENVEHRDAFSDEHDLTLQHRHRIEVKSRRLAFTSPDDYPYQTVFVYSLRGWQAKTHKPSAIIVVSQHTRCAVVVPRTSEPEWIVKRTSDTVRQIEYDVLEAPRAALRTVEQLAAWAKQR